VKCDSVEKRRSYRLFNVTIYRFSYFYASALLDLGYTKLSIQRRISYKLCVLMHLVHTGNSPSHMSDLYYYRKYPFQNPSQLGLTVMNDWQLGWSLANAVFPMLGLKLGTACPCNSENSILTFSSVNWKRFGLNVRSLHRDRLRRPLVTFGVSVGQFEFNCNYVIEFHIATKICIWFSSMKTRVIELNSEQEWVSIRDWLINASVILPILLRGF